MFGLSNFFSALKRLTEAVNRTAEMWEAANHQLEERLTVDEVPALPPPEVNGEKARKRIKV